MKVFNKNKYPKIKIVFTDTAYTKIKQLINNIDKEVAWHNTVEKMGENKYVITNTLVYPQVIQSAHVEADYEKYADWLFNLPDSKFNKLRAQGHSHVNMRVQPSGTDLKNQQEIMTQVKDYYIFMILNKDEDLYIKFIDIENNIVYEKEDLEIVISKNENKWHNKMYKKYMREKEYKGKNKTPHFIYHDEKGREIKI